MWETRLVKSEAQERVRLASFIANNKITGPYVEVGVYRGDFFKQIAKLWPTNEFYLIDTWDNSSSENNMIGSQEDLREVLRICQELKQNHPNHNYNIIQKTSVNAYYDVPHAAMVYIDADHKFESITEDLELWWNKVLPGGILAGHDVFVVDHIGVTQALLNFIEVNNLKLHLINGDKNKQGHHIIGPSWYIIKDCLP